MLKLGNYNLKDKVVLWGQYRKRRGSRDSMQKNNRKERIENKYNQINEYG